MTITEIEDLIGSVRGALVRTAGRLDPAGYSRKTVPDRWSPAEILSHLLKVEEMIDSILQRMIERAERKNEIPSAPPPGDIHVTGEIDKARPGFLSVPAFKGTEPRPGMDRDEMLRSLASAHEKTQKHLAFAGSHDLRGLLFPHPLLGRLNFYEWLVFLAVHEEVHAAEISA
jgi:hypothetical protein